MRDFKHILLVLLFVGLASCSGKKATDDTKTLTPGYWGQLAELEFISSNPLFLIYVKPTDIYKVCVADHLVKEHPQILNQIDASIKVWGEYINRKINTEVYTFEMEAPQEGEAQDSTFNKYVKACPNADVAVGYGNTDSVGLTASQYSSYQRPDGMKIVQDASKVVFLQNPSKENRKWVSLFTETDQEKSVEEIIKMLMKRDRYQFLVKQNELSVPVVLMHEFGHVWGLCDMYPLGNGHTNCDPTWSKKDENGQLILNPHATMAASTWKNPLYLHDDDIEGIRTLAARTRFQSDWENQKSFNDVDEAKDAEFFFQHLKSELTDGNLAFTFALYNNQAINFEISMMTDLGPLNYQPMKIENKIDTPQYTLNLGMPKNMNLQRLEFIIKDNDGNELSVHREVFAE
jgi:hypothetical protein